MKKILLVLLVLLTACQEAPKIHHYQIVYNVYYPNGDVHKVLEEYTGSAPRLKSYYGSNYIEYHTSKGHIHLFESNAPLEIVGYRILDE